MLATVRATHWLRLVHKGKLIQDWTGHLSKDCTGQSPTTQVHRMIFRAVLMERGRIAANIPEVNCAQPVISVNKGI